MYQGTPLSQAGGPVRSIGGRVRSIKVVIGDDVLDTAEVVEVVVDVRVVILDVVRVELLVVSDPVKVVEVIVVRGRGIRKVFDVRNRDGDSGEPIQNSFTPRGLPLGELSTAVCTPESSMK